MTTAKADGWAPAVSKAQAEAAAQRNQAEASWRLGWRPAGPVAA